ncbi:MAG: hypothetical protein ABI665_04750 [Vicinamibacterales bacterium]
MSYLLTVPCGCVVHVVRDPRTNHVQTRVIAQRGATCHWRNHDVGVRFFLWEMLPEPAHRQAPERVERAIEWQ